MQFGEAIDFAHASKLLSRAEDLGITFLDSAEMYPVPHTQATQGLSEQFIGRWMRTKKRENFVLSTKVTGPSGQMTYIRNGPSAVDAANIKRAVEGSLKRLQTDFIDIYTLHWPDRYVPMFGDNEYDPSCAYQASSFEEQFEALEQLHTAGKIRGVALSNETAYGMMRFSSIARQRANEGLIVALQNAYSLLCRTFDSSLAECCHHEQIGLVAYSPLAMGLLTGKYLQPSSSPQQARLNKYKGRYAEAESRYGPKPNVAEAVSAYSSLALEAGMEPLELALRFVMGRPLVASTIIGVTSVQQLEELVTAASKGPLPKDLTHRIDRIHSQYPNPTP